MNLLAAFIGKNASDDNASGSYNWVPAVCQGCFRYTAINCLVLFLNRVLCGQSLQFVRVINFTNIHTMPYWSYYFPCSCRSQYLRTSSLLYFIVHFGSLSTGITQLPNLYRHVGDIIFDHLIARDYNLFQKWTCLYSRFERQYFANHLRRMVGFNEYRVEAAYCFEYF